MSKYEITLKNGTKHYTKGNVDSSGLERSPIGLWKWSLKQHSPQVLSFGDIAILSTEIQSIEMVEGVGK